jgi:hypothetical protein
MGGFCIRKGSSHNFLLRCRAQIRIFIRFQGLKSEVKRSTKTTLSLALPIIVFQFEDGKFISCLRNTLAAYRLISKLPFSEQISLNAIKMNSIRTCHVNSQLPPPESVCSCSHVAKSKSLKLSSKMSWPLRYGHGAALVPLAVVSEICAEQDPARNITKIHHIVQ